MSVIGCSKKEVIKHNYVFTGENELWEAEYKVDATGTFTENGDNTEYTTSTENTLTVTYKKDITELASVKKLEISYQSSAGGGGIAADFNDNPPSEKTYVVRGSSKGGAIENREEVVKVNITLDGKTQVIEIKEKSMY